MRIFQNLLSVLKRYYILLKYTFHIAHLSEEQCNRERDYKAEIFKYFHITCSIKFVDKATITCKF